MEVSVQEAAPAEVEADLLCLGLFEDEALPAPFDAAPGAADAKPGYRKTALLRPERPQRVLVVGLGARDELDPERARVAAAIGAQQAGAVEAETVAWVVPEGTDAAITEALVEGTILGSWRFDRFKQPDEEDQPPSRIARLVLIGSAALAESAERARVVSDAQNRARELQSLPSNLMTPSLLAERAEEIAKTRDKLSVEVLGPEEIRALGMGGLIGVSQGSAEEPRLIVLRYAGGADGDEKLGLVGKGVTFDTGGISIKPAEKMHEMKMDMSGAAVVIEAVDAIAELEVPVNLIAVCPATENMPSSTAIKPGDIITQYNGKTVEILNTDAEGRLILADGLAFCVEQGAERIVDLATLTGAVITALGSTYAGLISNDDEWAGRVEAAAEESGELAWRLPLHEEYKELTKGKEADLTNASEKRKASTIYAGSFLEEFVDGKPWVHLDIAGTAWGMDREYVGQGPTGYGVRLLVALARDLAS